MCLNAHCRVQLMPECCGGEEDGEGEEEAGQGDGETDQRQDVH